MLQTRWNLSYPAATELKTRQRSRSHRTQRNATQRKTTQGVAAPCIVLRVDGKTLAACVTLHAARSPLFRAANEQRDFHVYNLLPLS